MILFDVDGQNIHPDIVDEEEYISQKSKSYNYQGPTEDKKGFVSRKKKSNM